MKIFILKPCICLLLILCSSKLLSQDKPEYSFALIDTSLIKNAWDVVRSEVTSYIIHSPKEYSINCKRTVTILNKESPETHLIVDYDKYSKAEIKEVVFYDAFGKFIRKAKKSEFIDHASQDGFSIFSSSRYLESPSFGGQLPYTIEYTWEVDFNNTILNYPDWVPQRPGESVEKSTFILNAPQDPLIHIRTLNQDFNYSTEIKEGRKIQIWTLLNSKSIVPEVSGPPYYELLPMILISPSVFQVENYIGSTSDWKSFGAFLYELNKNKEIMPPLMKTLIPQMTANCKTSLEKIDTLYHWLQKNLRYVSVQIGVGGLQAFDAAYVEKNRYGDCKALSTFMKGMLREVGIDSWTFEILASEEDALFLDDFASYHFNHRMLYIPAENMWLECTSNNLPTGEIDKDEQNKKVLLITPEGGKITRTPSIPDSLNIMVTHDTIFATNPPSISGKEEYHGNQQRGVRSLYYYASPEEQRKYFLEHCHLTIDKLDQLHISSEKSGSSSALSYKATLSKFGNASGNRLFIPVNSIQPPQNTCQGNTDRKTDFISRDNYTEKNDIYIALPPDYVIEYLPAKSAFDFKGNHYSVELKVEDQFIHVHHQITEAPLRLTPAEYSELCAYYTSVAKSNSQMIVLKKSKA